MLPAFCFLHSCTCGGVSPVSKKKRICWRSTTGEIQLQRQLAGLFLSIKLFSIIVEALALMAMAVLLPLAPFTCVLLSGRLQYLRQYRVTLVRSARYLFALGQARVISRNLRRRLGPHDFSAGSIEGSCTHCGRCCVNSSCVFLGWHEDGGSHCTIYNNWFWKMTSCGSYPVDAQSIDTYGCPSFKSVPIKVKVIARLKIPG